MPRGEQQKAQGVANAYAATDLVRQWGGVMRMDEFKKKRLGKSARRAVKLGLLVRNGSNYVLNQGIA